MASSSDSEDGSYSTDFSDISDLENDLENREEVEPQIGAQPYMFEPEFSDSEEESDEGDDAPDFNNDEDIDGRLGNNNWCSCSGGCVAMPVVRESVCCKQIHQIVQKMDAYPHGELDCITEHPGFQTVCLDEWVMETAYLHYRQQYGGQARQDATENQKYRHVAYRQLVRWCWGFLGRAVRVPLPSCAVTRIRAAFPSEEYRGFEEA